MLNFKTPRPVALACVAIAALVSIGCAGTVQLQPLQEMPKPPDGWRATSTAAAPTAEDLALWWRQLDDPTLDALVERVVSGNLDLQTAAARVTEARARRGLARAELGPSVSASSSAGRGEPLGDGQGNDTYSLSLDTAWEADLFGAKRLSLAASQADLEAGIEDLRAAQVSLVAETVIAYADLRVAEARFRVVDDNLASREETYQLASWREQAGLASQLEVSQAASNLEQTRASLPALERGATDARRRLDLLAGELPGALDELLAAGPTVPEPPDAVGISIPADVLRQRPDVRSAERGLEAVLARLGVAEAARYPTLRLSGSLDTQARSTSDLFDVDSAFANLLAGLTAPIFESGRIRSNIAVREAQAEQAALAYRSSMLTALSEVEVALDALHRSKEQIAALDDAVQAATEAADLADQRYAGGLVDLLSVLDTQRTLLSLEEQLALAHGERLTAFSRLYRALGGGWSPASPTLAKSGESHV